MKIKVVFPLLLAFLMAFGHIEAAQRGGRGNRSTARPMASSPRQQVSRPARSASRPAPTVRQHSTHNRSYARHYRNAPVVRPAYVRPYRSPAYYPSYYPSYGYGYGVGVGIGYGSYGYANPITGIRFNMDLVPKNDRKVVERGIVTIDGSEVGIVDRFNSWQNGHIPVGPGTHEITVQLEDGRVFQTETAIGTGEIRHIYLRFQNEK